MTNGSARPVLDAVRLLFRNLDDPAFAYTPDGTLVYVNAAYDHMFSDRYPDGTLGRNLRSLEPQKADLIDEMIATNLARKPEDPDLIIESPVLHADGTMHWYEWRCIQEYEKRHATFSTRKVGEEPAVMMVVVTSRDLTQQRLAELRAREVTATLGANNRDLREFARIASHDLQEPLRKVSLYCSRLEDQLDGKLDQESAEYIERMTDALSRMRRLITDLLAYALSENQDTKIESVDLNDTAADVLSDLELAVAEAKAVVTIADLPTLPGDPTQLRQLFQNLIGNGLKFRKPDAGGEAHRVEVTARHIPASPDGTDPVDGWYDISVRDNGVGFDPKHAGTMFDPFMRLHTTAEFAGTGVGLSVCRRIVERHDGEISATSTPGEGAAFLVRLPTSLHDVDSPDDTFDEQEALSVEHTIIDTEAA